MVHPRAGIHAEGALSVSKFCNLIGRFQLKCINCPIKLQDFETDGHVPQEFLLGGVHLFLNGKR